MGNILGDLLAGAFVDTNWGLSFIVPAALMFGIAMLVFLCLVPFPEMIFCTNPNHKTASEVRKESQDKLEDQAVVDSDYEYSISADHEPILGQNDLLYEERGNEQTESQKDKPAIGIKKALTVIKTKCYILLITAHLTKYVVRKKLTSELFPCPPGTKICLHRHV